MHFIILQKQKVVLLWSAKSACSTIKNAVVNEYIPAVTNKGVHAGWGYSIIPKNFNLADLEFYRWCWIVRNPFDRVISGFINKYLLGCPLYQYLPVTDCPNFLTFVNLLEQKFTKIDKHHFIPQCKPEFTHPEMLKLYYAALASNKIILIDINKLDTFTSMLDLPSITEKLNCSNIATATTTATTLAPTSNTSMSDVSDKPSYLISRDEFSSLIPPYYSFYTHEIAAKIRTIYESDFEIFTKYGLNYQCDKLNL